MPRQAQDRNEHYLGNDREVPLSYSGQDEDSFPTFDHPTHDMVSVKDSPFGAKGDGTTDDTLVRKQHLYSAKTES